MERKMERKMKEKSKKTIVLLLSLTLLLAGNLQTASAANLDNISGYSIYLSISPSTIEEGANIHPSGYIYILNKNGIPITSNKDIEITLSSDNSQIASVPEKIIFNADSTYSKFNIETKQSGTTTIVAEYGDKIDFKEITVGTGGNFLPDDLVLELNLPTSKMHVNSEMPFSVYLRTSEGDVIRAPSDIEITLEYEKTLATPSSEKLTIKQGENYAWGTIKTFEKIGNTFLRAAQDELQLDAVKNISISSTFPTSLDIELYPRLIPAEIDRTVDVFVSLRDSSGNPTIAHRDIPLQFFSDEQDYVGDELDDTMKETNMVIKKGQFGYHFQQDMDLIGLIKNNIIIGVSAEGYGLASSTFSTVGESISVENKRITDVGKLSSDRIIRATDDKVIQFFGPTEIPSNSTALFAYQLTIVEFDEDDPEEVEEYIHEIEKKFGEDYEREGEVDTNTESDLSEKVQKFTIDYLEDDELYPIQANDNYQSDGLIKLLNVVTSNDEIATVSDPGRIKSSYSYGVAQISTTQKSGPLGISVSVKGVGSETFQTKVVNSLELKNISLFSPTGKNTLLFERDGSFDLFLVALDSSSRPKILDFDEKFLITPTNSLIEIKKGSTYSLATLQGDSFSIENGDIVKLSVSPIGEGANLKLSSSMEFDSQLSSKLSLMLPTENVNVENIGTSSKEGIGTIQLVDLQGNPIPASKSIKVKIASSNKGVALVDDSVTIEQGNSFVEFPIDVPGGQGSSTISVSARGLVSGDDTVSAKSTASSLSIFTSGLVEPIPLNQEVSVKLFVDDDHQDSVAGAKIFIIPNENATVSTDLTRTGPDGSATFGVTALSGPEISVDFTVQAEGYTDGVDSIDILVDYDPAKDGPIAEVNLPQELVYVIIGGIAVVIIIIVLFLKKSKEPIEDEEEPWEDEDI
ncbi:MAG: hypothetical protein OEQ12_01745 [Nitrosopumilus sp.]|nr:hypothetical protein [Nitrosopumilus sp.]